MYQLKQNAVVSYFNAIQRGIEIDNTLHEIIDIILEQEIVSYCNEKGCVSFDYNDLYCEE